MTALGRLEKVELRHIWQTEAQDFTPWLAQEHNLELLGETLGLDLELEAVERNVGPFRADILCKDRGNDKWVLIENQLERTDHTHLGQLITYAAGLDAVTIVWIASRVADEHRAAVDSLNDITDDAVRFFVLEVELWKIADSPAAPKFNMVSQPNDWSRSTSSAKRVIEDGELSSTRLMQREYWQFLQNKLAERGSAINPVKAPAQSWLTHGIGRAGTALALSMNTRENWVRVEIYLSGPSSKGYFHLLEQKREMIEATIGAQLDWQRLDDKRDARICLARTGSNLSDRSDWEAQHEWLLNTMDKIHDVFRPIIRDLDREEAELLS